jgi:hypothetical protein
VKPHIRRRILKVLAQANPSAGAPASAPGTTTSAPASPTTTPAASTTTTTPAAITIDIRAIPGFRPQLFAVRPDVITDLNRIVGIVNKYLQALTQDRVNFTQTYTNPTISTSYVNSAKNLYIVAKWLLSVIRSQTPYYTLAGLVKMANELISTVQSLSFPEAQGQNAQTEIIGAARTLLGKLGGVAAR